MTKSVFLSGGAGGIGLATARRFVREGWRVGVGDLPDRAAALDEPGIEAFAHDVRDAAAWESVLDRFCAEDGGALDVLVNNAGLLDWGWFEQGDAAAYTRTIDVNVTGVVLGAMAAADRLAKRRGCMVNIGSAASFSATPRLAVYSATKFAVRGLSEALSLEWARTGVRVACIDPMVIDTPMLDSTDAGCGSFRSALGAMALLSADEVAAAVLRAVEGDDLHYPVGEMPERHVQEALPRLSEQRERWLASLTGAP
jgi:NAD(P)-dependent dehydrogenase (short-subunit alcohol dehydrogenase family)